MVVSLNCQTETDMNNSTTTNGTTYTTHEVTVKGNVFHIMVVSGRHNYINVTKMTNNPYRTCGKQFENFDQAQQNYKCAEMKLALLKVETGIA